MKVIKEIEQSLLLNHFGLAGKHYLSLTVLTFFAFDAPDAPLSEQDLWPFVQAELGTDAILDGAMPKLKAEVLVHGHCFTPQGTPQVAAEVGMQVGSVAKTLHVFGDRFWRRAGGTVQVITDPLPFTRMPLAWERAFGGTGFERNPLGRGITPVQSPGKEELWPLPNIEDPLHLIGAPSDRPEPAGLGPIDLTWPQRAQKTGTYDSRWLQQHWPFFPEDMDWTFFNAAPADQQLDGYFTGGEPVVLRNLHPRHPVLQTAVPRLRQRCFLNLRPDEGETEGQRIFKEIATRIDTLWLFPHAERGIAIFRGSTAVADDEALDVDHVFIATEPLAEAPKDIHHYHAVFQKRIDRSVAADITGPMEKAHQKLAAAAERLKDLPLEINDAIARNLGDAPRPVRTPHEIIHNALTTMDGAQQRLDRGEAQIRQLKADHGHRMKIDISGLDAARQQFAAAKGKLNELAATVDKVTAQKADVLHQMADKVRQALSGVDPALLKDKGPDPDTMLAAFADTPDPWQTSGMRFLETCRDRLADRPDLLAAFRAIGLRPYSLKRAWIGINPEPATFDRDKWGLAPDPAAPARPNALTIPAGLIIPCFEGATIVRITVRPLPMPPLGAVADTAGLGRAILEGGADVRVDGSKDGAMALGAGDKAFVRVPGEMDAILVHQQIGDMAAVIAMATAKDQPGKGAEPFVKKTRQFLVAGPLGPEGLAPWQALTPKAQALSLPVGSTVFEAHRNGLDLWQWVADALVPDLAPDPDTKPKEVDVTEPGALAALVPKIDAAAIIKKVRDRLTARMQAAKDAAAPAQKQMQEAARKQMAERGIDPEAVFTAPQPPAGETANPYAAAMDKFNQKFTDLKKKLAGANRLTPELELQLAEVEKKNTALLSRAAGQYDQGMAKLAEVKAAVKAGPPDWARKLLADAGIDPDDPAPLEPLNRDDVIAILSDGGRLAGRNISGADLSGLDLRGVDLKKTNMQKTTFTDAVLDGADLSGAIANEADFTNASVQQVRLAKGLFQKAVFVKAQMAGADLTQAVMSEADFSGADMSEATLEKTLLEKAILKGTRLKGAKAGKGYFLSADVSQATFADADLTKAVFLKANIDQTNFSRGRARGTIFIESVGDKVNFAGADLHNCRILNGSVMTRSDFTQTDAERACWMKSDLSQSDFRGCRLQRGLVQECNLSGADLSGVKARQARLTKTDLSDANLRTTDLMFGSLRKSKLVRTDLGGANLYGAEFYRTGVGQTRFDGANLKKTKLFGRTQLIAQIEKEKK